MGGRRCCGESGFQLGGGTSEAGLREVELHRIAESSAWRKDAGEETAPCNGDAERWLHCS